MKFNNLLKEIPTYVPGKDIDFIVKKFNINKKNIIKLASNENPYGVSSKVVSKLKKSTKNVFRYPDDSMYKLKNSLSKKYDVNASNIIIGAGSDQIIEICTQAKCNTESHILMSNITFAMYEISGKKLGAKIIKTKSDEHNLKQLYKLYKQYGADIIFLCLPNNPLGECLDKKDVYKFLNKISKETLVIIDGVYQEFASFKDKKKQIKPKNLINRFDNCIYLGSFSKAYGLGGMRIGYGIANEEIISNLNKIRTPFNVSLLSLVAADEALKDTKFLKKTIKGNFKEMLRYEKFAENHSINYIKSYTNFITYKFNDNIKAKVIADELLKTGIIIRDLTSYNINSIRITIGLPDENSKVLSSLRRILKNINRPL
jgi:histidinol-phosphate aminotransferase